MLGLRRNFLKIPSTTFIQSEHGTWIFVYLFITLVSLVVCVELLVHTNEHDVDQRNDGGERIIGADLRNALEYGVYQVEDIG